MIDTRMERVVNELIISIILISTTKYPNALYNKTKSKSLMCVQITVTSKEQTVLASSS